MRALQETPVLAVDHRKSAGDTRVSCGPQEVCRRYQCYMWTTGSLQEIPVLAVDHSKSPGDTSVSYGAW
jgi:hypothetical protein